MPGGWRRRTPVAFHRQVQCQPRPDVQESAQRYIAAATLPGERLHLQAVLVEDQRSVQFTEAIGKVLVGDRAILHLRGPAHVRVEAVPPTSTWKVVLPEDSRLGLKTLSSARSASPRACEPQAMAAGQFRRSRGGKVGSVSCHAELLKRKHLLLHAELNGPAILQLDSPNLG